MSDNKAAICTPNATFLPTTKEYELSLNCASICPKHKSEINVSFETSDGHFVGGNVTESFKVSFQVGTSSISGPKTVWVYMYRKGKPIEIDRFLIQDIPQINCKTIPPTNGFSIEYTPPGFVPYLEPFITHPSISCAVNLPPHYVPSSSPTGDQTPFYIIPVAVITPNTGATGSVKLTWVSSNFLLHEILINGRKIPSSILGSSIIPNWAQNTFGITSANFRNDWSQSYINLKGSTTSRRVNIQYVFKRTEDLLLKIEEDSIKFNALVVSGQGSSTRISDNEVDEGIPIEVRPHDPCFAIVPWKICGNCSSNYNKAMQTIALIHNDGYGIAGKVLLKVYINAAIDESSLSILRVTAPLGGICTNQTAIVMSDSTILSFEFANANLYGVNMNVFKQIGLFHFKYSLCADNNTTIDTQLKTYLYSNAADIAPADSMLSEIATTSVGNTYIPFKFLPINLGCFNCNCGNSGGKQEDPTMSEDNSANTVVENFMNGLFGENKTDLDKLTEDLQETQVMLAPNPTKDYLQVYYNWVENRTYTLTLYDLYGRPVTDELTQKAYISHPHQEILDINHLPKGIYLLRVTDGISSVAKKVLKE